MKLSQLSTEQALDAMVEMVGAIEDIGNDEDLTREIANLINKRKEKEGRSEKLGLYMNTIAKIVPILLKKKRESVYAILAALNGTDVDTVRQQNIIKTMKEAKEAFQDEDLVAFVKSCWRTEESAQ